MPPAAGARRAGARIRGPARFKLPHRNSKSTDREELLLIKGSMAFAAPAVGACASTGSGKASSLPWSRLVRPGSTAIFQQVSRRPWGNKATFRQSPKAQLGQQGSDTPLAKPSKTALLRLPKADLEKELSARGLPTTGLKQELAERLLQALTQQGQEQQQQQGPGQGGEPSSSSGQEGPAAGEGQPVGAEAELNRLTKVQLQERLVALGLPKTGRKEDLVARLLAAATPAAEGAQPPGREAAAAAGAASAASALPAGQPSSQGGGQGGKRRGGRLPPVAAVVAKKHEKDEIPAYPPESLDEEERIREALGPYAALPERAPEADVLPSGVLEEDELSSSEAGDSSAAAPQPVAGWRWKKPQAAAQPAAQAKAAAEGPAAAEPAPAPQPSQPAAAAGARAGAGASSPVAPPQPQARPQAGKQPQEQQAEQELQQAAETLKATGAGAAPAEEPSEPAGKEAAEEGNSEPVVDEQANALPSPAASLPSRKGAEAAADMSTPQPVASWRWKGATVDPAGAGTAPPSDKAAPGGRAAAEQQQEEQEQQPAEAASQTQPQAEDGAKVKPQPVAGWRWKPRAGGAAGAANLAATETPQLQAGEGDKTSPQPVADWRWKAGGTAAAESPASIEASAAPAAAGAAPPAVSQPPAEAATAAPAAAQPVAPPSQPSGDEPASSATAIPAAAASSGVASLAQQPSKPRPVAAWRWQGRQLPRACAAPANTPTPRAAGAADPAVAAAAQQPAQQQQQQQPEQGAPSSGAGVAKEGTGTKEAVPPLVQAVAAATANGELSLESAQLPTAETQALDDLIADIADDVLSEAATAAAFADGQETAGGGQTPKAQQQPEEQQQQQQKPELKAVAEGNEGDKKAQVAASAAPSNATPVAQAPARGALANEQSQGAGPLGLLRVLSAAREGARFAGALLDVVCRLVKGPK